MLTSGVVLGGVLAVKFVMLAFKYHPISHQTDLSYIHQQNTKYTAPGGFCPLEWSAPTYWAIAHAAACPGLSSYQVYLFLSQVHEDDLHLAVSKVWNFIFLLLLSSNAIMQAHCVVPYTTPAHSEICGFGC